VLVEQDANALLDAFRRYTAPRSDKAQWILEMDNRLRG
jgi:hypothetical protein